MADLSVTPIGTQVKPIQGMSLGEMLAAARSAQEYSQASQLNPLQLEKAQAELQRLQQLMPEELTKAKSEAEVAKETVTPRIAASKSQAVTAEAQAQEAQLKVLDSYLKYARPEIADLIKEPKITYQDIKTRLEKTVNNATNDPKLRAQLLAQGLQDIPENLSSDQYRGFLANSLVKTVSAEQQLATRFPSVSLVSTGAKTGVPITTGGAMAVQPPGQVGAGGVSMELPVGTEVYNKETGEYEYIGAPTNRAPAVSKPAPETAATRESAAAIIKEDMPRIMEDNRTAASNIALFQNVKKLAPEAITGAGAERRQMIASLGAFLGIEPAQLQATATEELKKNTKLLQLAGGPTDAARNLAELANPNIKMTKEAIANVADMLISAERMKQARARYMMPVMNNPQAYLNRRQNFDYVADPRLFLDNPSKEFVQKMVEAMSPEEYDKFIDQRDVARRLGILPPSKVKK